MGVIVIAGYRPHVGKDEQLLAEVRTHLPILRSEGLVTDRLSIVMRSKDSTILEVFEWVSREAIGRAHENPAVLEMWTRFAACCDYVPLSELPEIQDLFAGFEAVSLD